MNTSSSSCWDEAKKKKLNEIIIPDMQFILWLFCRYWHLNCTTYFQITSLLFSLSNIYENIACHLHTLKCNHFCICIWISQLYGERCRVNHIKNRTKTKTRTRNNTIIKKNFFIFFCICWIRCKVHLETFSEW